MTENKEQINHCPRGNNEKKTKKNENLKSDKTPPSFLRFREMPNNYEK